MISRPPSGMASRAFTTRLMIACSNCPGSIFTRSSSWPGTNVSSMSSPISGAISLRKFVQQRIQVDDPRLQHLLPAERQQLPREADGARSAAFQDLGEQLAVRIAGVEAIEHQLAVAVDHREQVVEVVRDAAGQPADRFHLLRLTELLLQPLQLRHVARHADQPDHVALRVAIDAFGRLIGARHARGGEPLLERLQRAGGDHLTIVLDDRSRRVRREQRQVVLTDHLVHGLAGAAARRPC